MSYVDWGFKSNPFDTTPLRADALGDKLLVGRDSLVRKIKTRLDSQSKIVTIEGVNGIGKTSLVNVMLFRAFRESIKTGVGPFYVPCRKAFQLQEALSPNEFRFGLLSEVAQTLLERINEIPPRPGRTSHSNQTALDRWLNSPQQRSVEFGLGAISGGISKETNTGVGFERSGFEKTVLSWLENIFPTQTSGAVVCVLDNLELLQTSRRAREVLEDFRDTVFEIRGIRWVLCGASGIIHGVAGSPRLEGRLHKPVEVDELPDQNKEDVFDSRLKAFRESIHSKLPISRSNFVELYDMMRGNLRAVLSECDDFCAWVADRVEDREEFHEGLFEEWLEAELEAVHSAVRSELDQVSLGVFEKACQFEVFSPSNCNDFGFEKPSQLRFQTKKLESVGLIQSIQDDSDKRKKSIQVTPKGWKLRAFLDYFG